MILNRQLFRFCNKNYHKLTGSLPGQTNIDIKERLDNFKNLYKPVDPIFIKEQQLRELREKFNQQNVEAQNQQLEAAQDHIHIGSGDNKYLKFMGIFCAGMFLYLLKETYIFYTNPKNIVLYDENTGKTYQTTKEEFEKIKEESRKNREYKEFRIKVLSKQQAEQLQQQQPQVRQKTQQAAKEEGLI